MSEAAYAVNPDPEHFARVLLSQPRTFEIDGQRWTLLGWYLSDAMRRRNKAQEYLFAVATHRYKTQKEAIESIGSSLRSGVHVLWNQEVPGFREVEDILWTEPITAANFICLISMPQVAAYWSDVINSRTAGPKPEAARFIAHISDPTLRSKPPTTAGPPGAPHQAQRGANRLNNLLELLGDEEDGDD